MSAKLVYSFSDDKSKQLGCINGFLQQFLTGRAITRHAPLRKTLPPSPSEDKIESKEATKEKKPVKNNNEEIPRISSESWMDSSSCSTSSTLSPFQHHAKALEEPKLKTRAQNPSSVIEKNKKKKPHGRRLSYDGKESKESIKCSLKLNELPRLSLDSRQERIKSSSTSIDVQEPGSNRPVSSIVAKLMGLEDLPQYTPKHNMSTRSEDLDYVSKSTEESDADSERHSVSIYKEIDRRLGELDFRKSGKDLRALKHILDAMHRTKANMESISEKSVTKPESRAFQQRQTPSNLPRLKTHQAAKPDGVEKRKPKDVSPKSRQTFGKHEKFSQEIRARSTMTTSSVQEHKNLTKQKTQTSRQITEARTRKVISRKPELDDHSDMVHTPRPSQILNKTMGNGANAIKDSMTVVKEQPSPVSVLDADFYGDEALSPVRKKATVFRDDDTCPVSTQAEWIVENTHRLYNSPTSSFRSYNIENIKEMPNRRELCAERSPVQPKSSYLSIEDDNDFLTSIITKDLAKRSECWTDFSSENSWLVLDIERLLFKDLIVELVHH